MKKKFWKSIDENNIIDLSRMTLGDMERLTYLTEFFELENYGIALWKEFGELLKISRGKKNEFMTKLVSYMTE